MNILIIGAGQVGCALAKYFERNNHDVFIISDSRENFSLLDNFDGVCISGIAIDTDVLKQAGIESCDAVAAVTDDDNVNLTVAQIAKNIFNVPKVLCRVYDPEKKNIFEKYFSIPTICPTTMVVNGIINYFQEIS